MRWILFAIIALPKLAWSQPPPQTVPAVHGFVRPAPLDPAKRTIIFVHGIGSNCSATFDGFIKECEARDIQAITFDYPNQGPIAKAGERFAAELQKLERDSPKLKYAIVAHSMGGLVTRAAIEGAETGFSGVTDVVTIATPHDGSQVATYAPYLRSVDALWALTPRKQILAEGQGEAGRDLQPDSEFMRSLRGKTRAAGVRYHVAAGKKGIVECDDVPKLAAEIGRLASARFGKNAEESKRIEQEIAAMDEIVNGSGDGAVALKRARLAGANSERIFDLDHIDIVRGPGSDPVRAYVFECLGWDRAKERK